MKPSPSPKAAPATLDPAAEVERWRAQAKALLVAENPLKMPLEEALKEAALVAVFLEQRWEPTDERPGLRRVQKRVPLSTAGEIRSLILAAATTQTRYLLLVDPNVVEIGERARQLIKMMESHIEFLLDDGVEDDADKKFSAIRDYHADDGERSAPLAQSLRDHATLAQELLSRLVENDEDFNPEWIAEAFELADKLATGETGVASKESVAGSDMAKLRNGLLKLMLDRVAKVRSAAKHVFRDFPDIVRESTSAYERRRRAAARRQKLADDAKKTAPDGKPA